MVVLIVSVEGSIGCGKSTLLDDLNKLQFSVPHVVVQENVRDWTSFSDSQGNNILQEYYRDQKKYSYCFQSLVLISRVNSMYKAKQSLNGNGIIITERSHLTDLWVFANMLYQKGAMTEIEWLTYKKCQSLLQEMMEMTIDLFVYLDATATTCMQRIAVRHREGEDLIPLKYINDLINTHEVWLDVVEQDQNGKVVTIDGNVDLQDKDKRSHILSELKTTIEEEFLTKQ